jgi:hypothetical protein
MSRPIFFRVLAKSRLRLLPPSMSTWVSCEPTTIGSRTSGNFLSSGNQLLHALGVESTISAKDDVDDVLRILEILGPRLVTFLVILLVFSLSCLREGSCIQ